MSDWQPLKIGDLGRVVTGKTPPTESTEYYDGDELFVSPKDLTWNSYYVDSTATRISEKALDKFKGQVIPRDTVMFTSLSFAFGKMGIASRSCITNQQINSIIVNDRHCSRFVYYLLRAYEPHIFAYNSGIDTPIVPKSVFERIPVLVPGKAEQEKIASLLSSYDDLIANNQRRIALLESMAEEIYREWFVRMRFLGFTNSASRVNPPAGWSYVDLPKLASITYGFTFAGDRFSELEVGKKIIRIRDVLAGDSKTYTDEVADDKYVVRAGDLLIGMDGEFHMNHWVAEDAFLVQRTCRVAPKQERLRAYVAHALKAPISHYQQTIVGATVGHLGAKHLNAIKLLVPPESLNPRLELLNQLLDQRLALSKQNLRLAKSRDALLPRLISGKLRVEALDIQFPPSMQPPPAEAAQRGEAIAR